MRRAAIAKRNSPVRPRHNAQRVYGMAISEKLGKKRMILLPPSIFMSSCVGESTAIWVAHEAIKCNMSPSSLRSFILHVAEGPLMRSPWTMNPPPKNSERFDIEILLFFFVNTWAHLAASVTQAPSNSNASAEKVNSTRIPHKTVRATLSDVDIQRPPYFQCALIGRKSSIGLAARARPDRPCSQPKCSNS